MHMGILDQMGDALNSGMSAVNRTVNRAKLDSQINDINRRRQEIAAQLGASLYVITRDNPEFRDGREDLYDGIAALDNERAECERQIEALEAAMRAAEQQRDSYTCVVCGSTVMGTDNFCGGCGSPAEKARGGGEQANASQASAATNEFTCPACGYHVPQDHKFCMRCGTRVERPA